MAGIEPPRIHDLAELTDLSSQYRARCGENWPREYRSHHLVGDTYALS